MKPLTHNERFGVIAGVVPQKRHHELATAYPAAISVGPATSPSRHHVRCKRATAQWTENEKPDC